MHGCQGCQELLLEYLYDLLDGSDRQVLEAHLAECQPCTARLEKVQDQQRLLAAAARMEFPQVRFETPLEQPTQEERTEEQPAPNPTPVVAPAPVGTIPMPLRKRPRIRWQRWAVAAGLLLALVGLAGTSAWVGKDYISARDIVEHQKEVVADAQERLRQAETEFVAAVKERDTEIEEVKKAIEDRGLRLVVSGPRTVQSGAPAEYLVRTYNLNGQPSSARVAARLIAERSPNRARNEAETQATHPLATGSGRPTVSSAGTGGGGGVEPKSKERLASAKPDEKGDIESDRGGKREGKEGGAAPEADALTVEYLGQGVSRVQVPPSLRLRPDQQFTMVVSARREQGAPTELSERVQLTKPVYLTHLTTDKPMYQPGETVRFRSLTVDRSSLEPAREDFRFRYTLTTPRKETHTLLQGRNSVWRFENKDKFSEVLGPDNQPVKGIGAGEFYLDPGVSEGGEYTLTVLEESGRFSPQTRKFTVNRYQKPRLDKKLDFARPSYGPGDEVIANCSAMRADGGPVKNRPVQVTVRVDEQILDREGRPAAGPFSTTTDEQGKVLVRFKLPANIERGEASLSVGFDDGGAPEPLVRTIPIVLKKVNVEFFPEGGDLLADFPNRVYFQARTPAGKPASIKGRLLANGNELPFEVATLADDKEPGVNQGTGVFTFTPRVGQKYELRIDNPIGIAARISLPPIQPEGVLLSVPKGVFSPEEPIRVQVRSTTPRSLLVGAYCRGRLLDSVQVPRGQTEVELTPITGVGGVCRVTVFEEHETNGPRRELRPVAERLIYRQPRERLDVSITPDRRRYVPGQKASLAIVTTDETERLKPSVVMVGVVDKSVVTLADEKTARSMPTHFLLTTEVRNPEDLEYADFLLGSHARAAEALDLLLGTQGWRRFAEQNPELFRRRLQEKANQLADEERKRVEEEGERLLVMIGQSSPQTTDFDRQKIERAKESFEVRSEEIAENHNAAKDEVHAAAEDPTYRAALTRLESYRNLVDRVTEIGGPVLAGVCFLLAGWLFLRGVRKGLVRGIPNYAGALVCLGILAVAVETPLHLSVPDALKPREVADHLPTPTPAPNLDEPAVNAPKDVPAPPAPGGGPPPSAPTLHPPVRVAPTGMAVHPPGMPGKVDVAKTPMLRGDKKAGEAKQLRNLGAWVDQVEIDKAPLAENRLKDARFFDPMAGGENAAHLGKAAKGKDKEAADALQNGYYANRGLRLPREMEEQARRKAFRDGKGKGEELTLPPMVVREYAHHQETNKDGPRSDFAETLYWHPVLVLPDGKAEVSFDLCDSVTNFQVIAVAHTLDGRLGSGLARLEVRQPLTLQPKLPVEVTASDRIDVPVRIANNTAEKVRVKIDLKNHDGLSLEKGLANFERDVPTEVPVREILSFRPTIQEGTAQLTLEGRAESGAADAIRESIRVVPEGFPVTRSRSDLIEKSATHLVELPKEWVAGTLQCRVDVYPSTLAGLQKGLESLLREPNGCFEQTSTTNYPNVLILDYLKESNQIQPEVERKARDLLARGYQKLTSFECRDTAAQRKRGYEWFGGTAPPHEALTAYGLLQFRDMARLQEVDPAMLKRTRDYLLEQRDGKGGFTRNNRAIDTFGRAPADITDAYIVWALTESGKEDDLKVELNSLVERAKKSTDPYFLALVAGSLVNRNRTRDAIPLLKAVAELQKEDGHLEATRTSITGSGGRDLKIETTALTLLGWLKANPGEFANSIEKAVRWLGQQRGGSGGFGSTQSTILTLKALLVHARESKKTIEAGEIRLFVDEEQVASRAFAAGVSETMTIELPNAEKHLKAGKNKVRVEVTGKNTFPHTLSWSYRAVQPDSAAGCPVKLTTTLSKTALQEGEVVPLTVKVENVSGQGQGMAVAIVGLPSGLSLPEDLKQLKEHAREPLAGKRPVLSAFELRGRELVLYWRDLAPGEVVRVPLELIARVPGEYRGPASRAYLYYNADLKYWVEPLRTRISAGGEK